jgi:F-type H+-transporting ATPase subunit gamma
VPNLKDIQRRIGSVAKTQQITRAMRMVAGAKLRRAQDSIVAARPYAKRLRTTLSRVAQSQGDAEHALLQPRPQTKNTELVVVTSNRGLCGAFNSNVLKAAQKVFDERRGAGSQVSVASVGRKAAEYFRRRGATFSANYPVEGWVQYSHAVQIASELASRFTKGQCDEVILVYSEFITAMTQLPTVMRLLPVDPEAGEAEEAGGADEATPFEIEPNAARLLEVLVPKAVEVTIFRALLENQAGEHAARMAAMESATRNTEELIDRLTLQFNRARQAAITKELMEIVSGAEAL